MFETVLDRTLYDFAEASLGQNREMQWSLSEPIARRQLRPLFRKCHNGELTVEQALDVCIDCVDAKLENNMRVLSQLYAVLSEDLGFYSEQQGVLLPAHVELEEYFVGLNDEAQWATSVEIAREELRPVFLRCRRGIVSEDMSLDVFCAQLKLKQDTFLEILRDIVERLSLQLSIQTTVGAADA